MADTPTRAIVISGGGAKGAWGVGVAKALSINLGNQYQIAVGTSTGSLMAPLVALRDFDRLEDIYTSVTQDDIFNVNPFNDDGSIRYVKMGWRLIKGEKTIGESQKLRETIMKFFKKEDYDNIKARGLDFAAAVTSLTTSKAAFQSTNDWSYEDMVDWAWASANTPLFMSTTMKNGEAWVDGGLRQFLPVSYAADKGADVIDVIIHNDPNFSSTTWKQKGSFLDLLFRILSVYYAGIGADNLLTGIQDIGLQKEHELNLYFMGHDEMKIIGEALVFNKEKMKTVLDLGFKAVINGTVNKQTYKLVNGKISGPN